VWLVGIFGHIYITTGCFDKLVKTLDDVDIAWEFDNQADFDAQSFTGFKWILGYSTSL